MTTKPKLIRNLDRRVVAGQVRYYDTTDQYAIFDARGRFVWYQSATGGDVRIS